MRPKQYTNQIASLIEPSSLMGIKESVLFNFINTQPPISHHPLSEATDATDELLFAHKDGDLNTRY